MSLKRGVTRARQRRVVKVVRLDSLGRLFSLCCPRPPPEEGKDERRTNESEQTSCRGASDDPASEKKITKEDEFGKSRKREKGKSPSMVVLGNFESVGRRSQGEVRKGAEDIQLWPFRSVVLVVTAVLKMNEGEERRGVLGSRDEGR